MTFAQATTLPVAGLTALYALEKGGFLLGRKVLVTGASGGVGHLACQLALASGAVVTALVRREERAARAVRWGSIRSSLENRSPRRVPTALTILSSIRWGDRH
ncbi:hypothetical protein LJK88_45600 [Paenibacillus sp. P26]|nr:hypothetical protein LJK88_45600 [Paenibacillus sp. P26]